MKDPVFKTRDELEAWATHKARACQDRQMMLDTLADIKRVMLAHGHLMVAA